jgi:hypothetical protein
MIDRAIKLFGTDEPVPEQRRLVAGPVTATLEGGQLRWIKVGDTEVIRAIAFLIRDRIWSTCPPKISNLRIDEGGGGFVVTFDALTRTADGDLPWHAEFRGTPDGTIRCEAVARPEQDFLTCRTGFVILHPLAGVAGRAMEIEHVDGTVERTEAPQLIDPAQPFLDVRAMTHEPLPGVRATLRMEGDTWETEDHRNWSDASFKTYSRPLVLPWPYTVPGGTEIRHTVTLSFAGRLPDAPASEGGSVTVTLGRETGPMPRLGLSVLPEDAELALSVADLVKQAGPQHLNCRIDLRDAGWQDALPRYRELAQRVGAEVVLEIIIPGAERAAAEVERAAAAVQAADLRPAAVVVTPAADLKSYPPGTPLPEGVPSWQEIIGATRAAFPRARIGGGMLSNFTELNRKRPPAELLDFVTHATSTLIHACDDRTVMENLETIGHIIRSTQAFSGDTAYRIGPAHIGNSFNPYGADRPAPPRSVRRCLASRLLQRGRPRRPGGGDHGLARRRVRHRLRQVAACPVGPRRHRWRQGLSRVPRDSRPRRSGGRAPDRGGLERSREAARSGLARQWANAALACEPARGAARGRTWRRAGGHGSPVAAGRGQLRGGDRGSGGRRSQRAVHGRRSPHAPTVCGRAAELRRMSR